MSLMLEAELLAHLDAQLASARHLLGLVLEQGKAIRARDVDGVLGKLALVTVRSPQALTPIGDNAFQPSAASGAVGPAPRATKLTQGALEASNVDMASAMVAMIESQRAFELVSKAIHTADQMWEIANGVKR